MKEIFDDIRKLYIFREACPDLRGYIEFFSETSLEATRQFIHTDRFSIKLFPSYTPTIWLNLGSPYQLLNKNRSFEVGKSRDILVLRSTILERINLATDNIFTIKFKPLGFESIFGFSQARIGCAILPAKEVLGTDIIRKIKNLETLSEKVALIESFLLAKLHHNRKNGFYLTYVKQSIESFSASGMDLKLSGLANQLCISEKTLYRSFSKAMGTNPKKFLVLTRCRAALTAYKKSSSGFSALDFGYYDFAHFSKDVKSFTGSNLTSIMSIK